MKITVKGEALKRLHGNIKTAVVFPADTLAKRGLDATITQRFSIIINGFVPSACGFVTAVCFKIVCDNDEK